MPHLKIRNSTHKSLPNDFDMYSILEELFDPKKYEMVEIIHRIENKHPYIYMFLVRSFLKDGIPELETTIKIGPWSLIEKEAKAYKECMDGKVSNIPKLEGKSEPVENPYNNQLWGGIRYTLAGGKLSKESQHFDYGTSDPRNNIISLLEYLQKGNILASNINRILNKQLFHHFDKIWQHKKTNATSAADKLFDIHLMPNLVINLDQLSPAEQRVHLLTPQNYEQKIWAYQKQNVGFSPLQQGDYIELDGFEVTEIEQIEAANLITLNLPGVHSKNGTPGVCRLRLKTSESIALYQLGKVMPHPVKGCIVKSRQEDLQQLIETSLTTSLDLNRETLPWPADHTLPNTPLLEDEPLLNPLIHLPMLLGGGTYSIKQACIHGDLHLENIVIDPITQHVSLIDFGSAREDYVLHDFLRLETDIITRWLAPTLHDAGESVGLLLIFYLRLHQATYANNNDLYEPPKLYTTNNVALTALQRVFVALATLRQGIKPYLFRDNDWREYYRGLAIYLLAALKFSSLDEIPLAKNAAFWGATIITTLWGGRSITLPNPYKGLDAFTEADTPFFFGRAEAIHRLREKLKHKSLNYLIGASGNGKSSLVAAGLLPLLKQEGNWLVIQCRPDNNPFEQLALALTSLFADGENADKGPYPLSQLISHLKMSPSDALTYIDEILKKHPQTPKFLLIIDQFEEIFTITANPTVRKGFINLLLQWQDHPQCTLLLILRADFMAQLTAYGPLADTWADDMVLGPMTDTLRQAIEYPAEKLGLGFETGLPGVILADLKGQPGDLPLLEFTLTELWRKQQQGKLTHQAYQDMGGVKKALSAKAQHIYQSLSEYEQVQARIIFLRLVFLRQEHQEATRRKATRLELGEERWRLVQKLADKNHRLLTTDSNQTQTETVEIVHETLLQAWDLLKTWIDQERDFLLWHKDLQTALQTWENANKERAALLRGKSLRQAKKYLTSKATNLSQAEKDFIQTSLNQQRFNFLGGLGLVILIITLLTISILTISILSQQGSTPLNIPLLDYNPNLTKVIHSPAGEIIAMAFNPEQNILAYAGTIEGRIALYNTATNSSIGRPLSVHINPISGLTFSSDGNFLAATNCRRPLGAEGDCEESEIHLWDMTNPTLPQPKQLAQPTYTGTILSLAFGNYHPWLASGNHQNPITIQDIETGQQIASLKADKILSLAFSPDDTLLVSGHETGDVILWHLDQNQPTPRYLKGHTDIVHQAIFSHDGQRLASASKDGQVIVWDIETGTPLYSPLIGHTGTVRNIAFSPDDRLLASGGEDSNIILWDVKTGQTIGQPLTGHADLVNHLAFTQDGNTLISSSDDERIILWDITPYYTQLTANTNIESSNWQPYMCQLMGRNFTWKEWQTYLPDQSYQKICPLLPVPDTVIVAQMWEAINQNDKVLYGQVVTWTEELDDDFVNYYVCSFGSYAKFEQSISFCERMVDLAPEDGRLRGARGLAWVIFGLSERKSEAIADLEAAIAWYKAHDVTSCIKIRQDLVEALKKGNETIDLLTLRQFEYENC